MAFSDLRPETVATLKTWRYDRIIEKHEGPESWDSYLSYEEPIEVTVDGRRLLLPVSHEEQGEIIVLRSYASLDESSVTLFFKDMSLAKYYRDTPELFWAGFFAVCDRIPGKDEVYAAVVYHEWFIVENPSR